LMANFWCTLYIFYHLLNFEVHKRNNIHQINLPLFHRVNVVDANYSVAPFKEAFGEVEADEAGSTGD
jgi:hypothetical protein